MAATSKRQTLKHVVSVIEREFIPVDSRKRNPYAWPVKSGFSAWLGLNTILGRADGFVGLNPIVGVISDETETLVRRFDGSAKRWPTPTISISLGYLSPEERYIEWLFAGQSEPKLEAEVKKLIEVIRKYGMPFIESNASLPTLVNSLVDGRFTYKESAIYRRPIAHLVLGQKDEARQYVTHEVDAIGQRTDEAADQYRRFAARLLRQL
jgi:hypothetical protein